MRPRIIQRVVAGMTCLAIALLMTGCAQPPTDKLSAAKTAVEAAQATGAPEYAKEDFVALEQQFALAKDELAKQEKALSIFRSYSEADALLTKVVEQGKQVEAKATTNKEAAKTAAITTEKEARQFVDSAKELMAKAPTGKEKAAVEAIKADISALETNLETVHQLIEKGNYIGAELQAKTLKEKGAAISEELQNAIAKVKGNKGKAHA